MDGGRIYRKRAEVVSRQIAGESLLIPIHGRLADMQKIFALDPVAECIWGQINGDRSLEEILRHILSVFDVAEEQARSDLAEFVAQLVEAGLIEEAA